MSPDLTKEPTQRTSELWQALGAENQQANDQDDYQLSGADVEHAYTPPNDGETQVRRFKQTSGGGRGA